MKDLLLHTTTDLLLPLQRGSSTKQHQQLLLVCAKGEFKENPTATVGVINFLETENEYALLQEIRKSFIADGMSIDDLSVKNGKIIIDAKYNSTT